MTSIRTNSSSSDSEMRGAERPPPGQLNVPSDPDGGSEQLMRTSPHRLADESVGERQGTHAEPAYAAVTRDRISGALNEITGGEAARQEEERMRSLIETGEEGSLYQTIDRWDESTGQAGPGSNDNPRERSHMGRTGTTSVPQQTEGSLGLMNSSLGSVGISSPGGARAGTPGGVPFQEQQVGGPEWGQTYQVQQMMESTPCMKTTIMDLLEGLCRDKEPDQTVECLPSQGEH